MANEIPNPAPCAHPYSWFDPLLLAHNSPHKLNGDWIRGSLLWTLHICLSTQLLKAFARERESLQRELSKEVRRHKETQQSLDNLRSTVGSYVLAIETAQNQTCLEEERCEEAFAALEKCTQRMERECVLRFRAEEGALEERHRREMAEASLMKEVRLREAAEERASEECRLREAEEEKAEEERKRRIEAERIGEARQQPKYYMLLEYSPQEIGLATSNFDASRVLQTDEWGSIYKGELHHIPVAIRVLAHHGSSHNHRQQIFKDEVGHLGCIHHPHIVMLLGACPDNTSIVYEFMSNGTLEHHLDHKSGAPPLPWYVRFEVCYDVATALLFLHSLPEPVAHGNLDFKSIFLDHNFVSKIGNVGMAKLSLGLSNIGTSNPLDTINLEDDVYALGITMLRLLTGLPANQVVRVVEEELDNGRFSSLLDHSAGEWPLLEAMELACLSLRVIENAQNDLLEEIVVTLESIKASVGKPMDNCNATPSESRRSEQSVPSHFLCPISQEIMENPCVGADGFTYEHDFIKAWLQNHENSPMTNLKLDNKVLIPNLSLKSAIHEWRTTH